MVLNVYEVIARRWQKNAVIARSDLSNREIFSWRECDPQGSASADTSNVNFSGIESWRLSVFTVFCPLYLSSNAQSVNRRKSYSKFCAAGLVEMGQSGNSAAAVPLLAPRLCRSENVRPDVRDRCHRSSVAQVTACPRQTEPKSIKPSTIRGGLEGALSFTSIKKHERYFKHHRCRTLA